MVLAFLVVILALAGLLRLLARDPPHDSVSAAWVRAQIRERRDG